jgi:hypothetical protein
LKNTGANYVGVCVTQFLSNSTSNTIFPDPNYTETDASVIQAIKDIHARGMGVMLKPMLNLQSGGDGYNGPNPSNPAAWFASYTTMVDHYAYIAQNNGVELFCVGCELYPIDQSYSSNWSTIISGVRAIYSGPLTYASNDFSENPFWGLLDYVGIDAYFPVSAAQTPTVAECVAGWTSYDGNNWLQGLANFQASIGKPILFTEIGYRSIDYAAKSPGDWKETGVYNANGQANCYEAVLQVFANKPWFAGMFWWDWSPDPKAGGVGDVGYTPQNKPAQSVLAADWHS